MYKKLSLIIWNLIYLKEAFTRNSKPFFKLDKYC